MIHFLKTEQKYFCKSNDNVKLFEIRKNDRDFKVDDTIYLVEIDGNGEVTNRMLKTKIKYITDYNQKDDYVVLGFNYFKKLKIEKYEEIVKHEGFLTAKQANKGAKALNKL